MMNPIRTQEQLGGYRSIPTPIDFTTLLGLKASEKDCQKNSRTNHAREQGSYRKLVSTITFALANEDKEWSWDGFDRAQCGSTKQACRRSEGIKWSSMAPRLCTRWISSRDKLNIPTEPKFDTALTFLRNSPDDEYLVRPSRPRGHLVDYPCRTPTTDTFDVFSKLYLRPTLFAFTVDITTKRALKVG